MTSCSPNDITFSDIRHARPLESQQLHVNVLPSSSTVQMAAGEAIGGEIVQ